jgi:hypothetical protein
MKTLTQDEPSRGPACSRVRRPGLAVQSPPSRTADYPTAGNRARRGQTLILALSVLFLLIVVASIFVGMVLRNLIRSNRGRQVSRSEALAWAGIRFAAQEFGSSLNGADWRPIPSEDLWRNPDLDPADPQFGRKTLARQLDPDNPWLDPATTQNRPYVRYRSGDGRFLVRVEFVPRFRQERPQYAFDHDFDPNSALIHVEAIGRPGIVDPDDPTTLQIRGQNWRPGQIRGEFRKVEAWVPVGLTEQLLWITNRTGERGPATLGVSPLKVMNPNAPPGAPEEALVRYDDDPSDGFNLPYPNLTRFTGASYYGGIKSAVDLQIQGDVSLHLFPARAEEITVNGRITYVRSGDTPARVRVIMHEDGGDPDFIDHQVDPVSGTYLSPWRQAVFPEGESGQVSFDPVIDPATGRAFYKDNYHLENPNAPVQESIRNRVPPVLDQENSATGIPRYVQLTRESGQVAQVQGQSEVRNVNTGWYGHPLAAICDPINPANIRANYRLINGVPVPDSDLSPPDGLYLDNFADIQYPLDRKAVLGEWMQNGQSDVRRTGWVGPVYIPTVRDHGTSHPVAELAFVRAVVADPTAPCDRSKDQEVDVIRITRSDIDARKMNFGGSAGRTRIFYAPMRDPNNPNNRNALVYAPVGPTALFAYPRSGVIYCEGSVRVRGRIPAGKQVTLVSGGTVYIEGNLLRGQRPDPNNAGQFLPDRTSFIGLLAQDYVTVNPTAFTLIRPGEDTTVEADLRIPGEDPTTWHYVIPPNGDVDVMVQNADRAPTCDYVLHVAHTAQAEDVRSQSEVRLYWINQGFDATNPATGVDFKGFPPYPDSSVNGALTFRSRLASAGKCDTSDFGNDPDAHSYHFFFFPPNLVNDLLRWNFSNFLSQVGGSINYERKSLLIPNQGSQAERQLHAVLDDRAGAEHHLKFWVPPTAAGQPYWLGRVALIPYGAPLKIQVNAVMYAQNGSWFVIPPRWFNEAGEDTRAKFRARGQFRAAGTKPESEGIYPFYHEPLNVDIEIHGAITENMPADPADRNAWTARLWTKVPEVNAGAERQTYDLETPGFSPRIRYFYEHDLRRLVRYRVVSAGKMPPASPAPIPPEGIAYTAPLLGNPPPLGSLPLDVIVARARSEYNGYVVTMPVLPLLPSGPVIYEGSVVQ